MKKILFIQHWSSVGGSGISFYNTWNSLKDKYNIVAYIPNSPYDLYEFLISKGMEAKTYSFTCGQIPYYSGGSDFYKPGFWLSIINIFFQISYWKNVIEKEAPDIIMVNSKVLCWMAPLFKGKKSVCFVRETIKGSPHNPINKLMKVMLEKFSLVSFLSEYDLIQTNLKKAKSVVSPDILNPEEYIDKYGKNKACELLGIDSKAFNIAFVGGIDRLKGIDILVKAMNYLKGENITLIVAGNDIGKVNEKECKSKLKRIFFRRSIRYSKKIWNYIKEQGLSKSIKYIGVQTDISIVYSASDVLVFPMKKPHQARPAFEIGVQRKPVIISNYGNIHEFVKHMDNGIVFKPNDPKDLARVIKELSHNYVECNKLGESNYRYSIKYHTKEYSIGNLLNAMEHLYDRGG